MHTLKAVIKKKIIQSIKYKSIKLTLLMIFLIILLGKYDSLIDIKFYVAALRIYRQKLLISMLNIV